MPLNPDLDWARYTEKDPHWQLFCRGCCTHVHECQGVMFVGEGQRVPPGTYSCGCGRCGGHR